MASSLKRGLGVLDEVEQVGVAAGELVLAVDAEGVVPDDPVSEVEADVAMGDHLELGDVFVADGQPEGAVRRQDAGDLGDPAARPVEVVVAGLLVVVDVVVVADVEGGVGEGQVDAAVRQRGQAFEAVAPDDAIEPAGRVWRA